MSSLTTAIIAVLEADSGAGGVGALCTGGIYDADAIVTRLNRTDHPGAYDASGRLKPLLLVRERSAAPWGGVREPEARHVSVRRVVDLTFLDDRENGPDAIEAARDRAYALLHEQFIGNHRLSWMPADINSRDQALNDAHLRRASYGAVGSRRG